MVHIESTLSGRRVLPLINIFSFLLVIVVNGLANILPLGGNTTGELSALYPNLFVPDALTFAIWGVIYLTLGVFVVYQGRDIFSQRKIENPYREAIGWLFTLSCLANIGWIFAWHYQKALLSLVAMLVLLCCLIMIYLRLDIGGKPVNKTTRYLVHLPFSLYLGWITVATIANVTAVLVYYRWSRWGLSEVFWTILVIFAGTIITLVNIINRYDIAFSSVVIWAYLGIIIKRYFTDTSPILAIVYSAALSIVVIVLGLLFFRKKDFNRKLKEEAS